MTSDQPHIGIITDEEYADLTEDGQAIATEIKNQGYQVDPVVWSDAGDLSSYDIVLIRSCWDYHTDFAEFQSFLEKLEENGVTAYNPVPVIRWNAHKSYYSDLEDVGVPIPPSVCLERGTEISLKKILREQGWDKAVIKPAVGAGSAGVWRTSIGEAKNDQARFNIACADGDTVVQQFVPEISQGERSIVFIRGEYSHAWNDLTKPGDFSDFTEPDLDYDPNTDIIKSARAVLEQACTFLACEPADLPYARVDYVERDNDILVLELELIEPYLGLAREDGAVETFVSSFVELFRNIKINASR